MSNEVKTPVIIVRDLFRTNGKMSECGKFITYTCIEVEEFIQKGIEMEAKINIKQHE